MLGAQFNLAVLREIFAILKSHFINQNLPIANIMSGVVQNEQMPVISVMMNAEDKLGMVYIIRKKISFPLHKLDFNHFFSSFHSIAFTKLTEYMRIRGEDAHKIDTIQKIFDDLISM